jgi:hypothetical protein
MAAMVRGVHPALKSRGFRKRRHNFNRTAEDGVIEVVGFQMGANEQFGDYSREGMRFGLYGQFAINIGVVFEEVGLLGFGLPPRPFYSHPGANGPSVRLGALMHGRDLCWPLVGDPAEVADGVVAALEGHALPWLEQVNGRTKLLRAWRAGFFEDARIYFPMAALCVAVVCWRSNDAPAARTLIAEYLRTDLMPDQRTDAFKIAKDLELGS